MRRLYVLVVTLLTAAVSAVSFAQDATVAVSEKNTPSSGLFTVNDSGSKARLVCIAAEAAEGADLQAAGYKFPQGGQWEYILFGRSGSRIGKYADARFAVISVADTLGMLLLPDSFVWKPYMGIEPFVFNNANVSKVPEFTPEQRDSLLAGGCVFVPDGCPVAYDGPVLSRISFGKRPEGVRATASVSGYVAEGETVTLFPHSKSFDEVTAVYSVTRSGHPSVTVPVDGNRFVMPDFSVNVEVVYVMGMVDLGLPSGLKWASMNIGADSPEGYGSYFSWGEIAPKAEYQEDHYFDPEYVKYSLDGALSLEASDDAARAALSGDWRLPTLAEWEELRRCCIWKWESYGGRSGYRVTSKAEGNDNSIFIPAAGRVKDTDPVEAGSVGNYWTSELGSGSSRNGRSVHFSYGYFTGTNYYRFFGLPVRAVSE